MNKTIQLDKAQMMQWQDLGFLRLPGLFSAMEVDEMLAGANEIAWTSEKESIAPSFLVEEKALADIADVVGRLSKIFRIHRNVASFKQLAQDQRIVDVVEQLLGTDLDCFLSQFIFKNPGALGQPWHQDSYYFPFEGPPQVGVWIAVTQAHENNGPLSVLPGSHREHIHQAVKDRRANANPAYVEIVDQNFDDAQVVLMQPGDVLFFHSHLMHKSTDNKSNDLRAAMVYHYATADTVDHSIARLGAAMPNVDWMSVRRS